MVAVPTGAFVCGGCGSAAVTPRAGCSCGGPVEARLIYCSGCGEWQVPDAFRYVNKYATTHQTSWRSDGLHRLCSRCIVNYESSDVARPSVYRIRNGKDSCDSYVGSCVLGALVRYREHLYSSTVYCSTQKIHERMAETDPESWELEVLQDDCEPWCLKQYELAWMCLLWPNLNSRGRVIAKDENASRNVGNHEYPRAMVRFYLEEDDEGRELVRLDHSDPRPWPPEGTLRRDQWLEYFLGRIELSWGDAANGSECPRCLDNGHGNVCPIEFMDNYGLPPLKRPPMPEYEESFGVPECVTRPIQSIGVNS